MTASGGCVFSGVASRRARFHVLLHRAVWNLVQVDAGASDVTLFATNVPSNTDADGDGSGAWGSGTATNS